MRFLKFGLILCTVIATSSVRARQSKSGAPRRGVLGGLAALGALGAGLGTASAGAKVIDAMAGPREHAYAQTVFEQNLMLIGEVITNQMLRKATGLEFGNSGTTKEAIQEMLKNPVQMWANMAVVAPLVEETLFRSIPAAVFGTGWGTGTATSLVFAAAHGLEKIPLGQFVGGLWFWYLMKYRGISHAMLAHAANNHAVAIALLLGKALDVDKRAMIAARGCQPLLSEDEATGLSAGNADGSREAPPEDRS